MSSLMHAVFGTEITDIPSGMQTLLGTNFNNELCNGVTWLVFFWITLLFFYDSLMNFYLKQLGFSQYIRIRLSGSLWLLALYVSFFVYYLITINEYNISDLMYYKRTIATQDEIVSDKQKIAQALVCSFYLCMAYREGTQIGSLEAVKYIALTIACTTSFILGYLEIPFTITALIAVSGIFQELSKMFYSLLNKENSICNVFIGSLYISSVIIFSAVYFTIIPLSYLIPLGMKLFTREGNLLMTTLFLALLCWINLVIYKSIFLNAMFHWLYHIKTPSKDKRDIDEDEKQAIQLECLGNIVECSLFPPRKDDSFMLAFMRSEVRKRQRKMIALRKPKNKALMIQTIRCVMTLQKKLSRRKSTKEKPENNEQNEPTVISDIEETESRNNDEERLLIPVRETDNIYRLSKEEVVLRVENLETKDNAEEEESEIGNVQPKSKSDISINEAVAKESESDDDNIEVSPSTEKYTQTMIASDETNKIFDTLDENASSMKEYLSQEKSIEVTESDIDARDASSKNVGCRSKICAELTKKEEGKGNGKNYI